MEQLSFSILDFLGGAIGFLAAALFVAYWAYALRLIIDMKMDVGIKIAAILANLAIPFIFPLVVYVYYLGWYRRVRAKHRNEQPAT